VRRARLPVALPQVLAVSAALQDRADLAYWLPPAAAAAPPAAAAAAGAAARPVAAAIRSAPDAAVGDAGAAVGAGAEGDDGSLAADSQQANGGLEREADGGQQAQAGADAAHEAGGGAPAGGLAERAGEGAQPWLPLALEVGLGAWLSTEIAALFGPLSCLWLACGGTCYGGCSSLISNLHVSHGTCIRECELGFMIVKAPRSSLVRLHQMQRCVCLWTQVRAERAGWAVRVRGAESAAELAHEGAEDARAPGDIRCGTPRRNADVPKGLPQDMLSVLRAARACPAAQGHPACPCCARAPTSHRAAETAHHGVLNACQNEDVCSLECGLAGGVAHQCMGDSGVNRGGHWSWATHWLQTAPTAPAGCGAQGGIRADGCRGARGRRRGRRGRRRRAGRGAPGRAHPGAPRQP